MATTSSNLITFGSDRAYWFHQSWLEERRGTAPSAADENSDPEIAKAMAAYEGCQSCLAGYSNLLEVEKVRLYCAITALAKKMLDIAQKASLASKPLEAFRFTSIASTLSGSLEMLQQQLQADGIFTTAVALDRTLTQLFTKMDQSNLPMREAPLTPLDEGALYIELMSQAKEMLEMAKNSSELTPQSLFALQSRVGTLEMLQNQLIL
jgi:hypothetical protein